MIQKSNNTSSVSSDFLEIVEACVDEKLEKLKLFGKKQSLCVVLCSKGYPDNYEKNIKINNFDKIILNENNYLFHAGTKIKDNQVVAVGGRVLNFISLSDDLIKARQNIHNNLEKLDWNEGFYRKDIAFKVIDK